MTAHSLHVPEQIQCGLRNSEPFAPVHQQNNLQPSSYASWQAHSVGPDVPPTIVSVPSLSPLSVPILKLHSPNLVVNSFRAKAVSDSPFSTPEHAPKAMPFMGVGQRLTDRYERVHGNENTVPTVQFKEATCLLGSLACCLVPACLARRCGMYRPPTHYVTCLYQPS